MRDQEEQVRRGRTAYLGLTTDVTLATSEDDKSIGRSGAYTDVDEDEPFVFRRGDIQVFDLGTRTDEDGIHRITVPFLAPDSTPTGEVYRTNYGAQLLAPGFSTALQLPQDSEKLFVDLGFSKMLEDETFDVTKWIQVGHRASRPLLQTLVDGAITSVPEAPYPPDHDDAGEQSAGKWKGTKGKLTEPGGDYALSVASPYFQTFTTTNTDGIRVTATPENDAAPSAEDDEVDFSVRPGEKFQLYLAPRIAFVRESADDSFPLHFFPMDWSVPDYEPSYGLHRLFADSNSHPFPAASLLLDAGQWAALVAYVLSVHPGSTVAADLELNLYWLDEEVGFPILVAVVVKSKRTYYLWRMNGAESLPFRGVTLYPPL